MKNVTKIYFGGERNTAYSEPLYQYDYGQIIRFPDLELPQAYEVHFSKEGDTQTVSVIGSAEGVSIPDECLQVAGKVSVYIFLHEGDSDGETEYKAVIPVIGRPEPSNQEPTPVQQDVITQTIAALNQAVEDAEAAAEDAENSAEAAQTAAGSIPDHVLVYDDQTLTDGQQTQARSNIGASNAEYEIHHLKDGSANHSLRATKTKSEDATYTMGTSAFALGESTQASGVAAVAEGQRSSASGGASHAEGADTVASNTAAHAEGRSTVASGQASHAEGYLSQATVSYAHAEGRDTRANGLAAHAEGEYTRADGRAQHVIGQYNVADAGSAYNEKGQYVEIVGNGTADDARSNARTLDWNGNEIIAGKLTVGAQAVNANDVPTLAQVQALIEAALNNH